MLLWYLIHWKSYAIQVGYIKTLTAKLDDISSLYAFYYQAKLDSDSGWDLYKAVDEYKRMGVDASEWRITSINKDYKVALVYYYC